jgi:hypothetical protein
MIDYGRFEEVVKALEGAVLQSEYLVGGRLDDALAAEQALSSRGPSVMN